MANRGPILVKPAPEEEEDRQEFTRGVAVDIVSSGQAKRLSVPLSDDVLSKISDNTSELQDRLNKFINGLNSKIQSVGFQLRW